MRVLVLGHRGMLGHVVARHLSENQCEVITFERRFAVERAAELWLKSVL